MSTADPYVEKFVVTCGEQGLIVLVQNLGKLDKLNACWYRTEIMLKMGL